MKYTLIKGTFHVVGYSPDGDSIMFKAHNRAHWDKIGAEYREVLEEKLAAEGGALQLRLQGIDALETHYTPARLATPPDVKARETQGGAKPDPGDHKQPAFLARRAAEEFMGLLGVRKVEWRSFGRHTWVDKIVVERRGKEVVLDQKHEDALPGYIVTRDVEAKGRPIAWVFPGTPRDRDGAQVTQARLLSCLEQSANFQLLKLGLAYPYFFMTLAAQLRDKLTEAVRQARAAAAQQAGPDMGSPAHKPANIWSNDKTMAGLKITSLANITEDYELFPYLFRKVIKHWYQKNMEDYWNALRADQVFSLADSQRVNLEGFFDGGNPYIFVVGERDFLKLDEVVEIKKDRLRMTRHPFDIVFLS